MNNDYVDLDVMDANNNYVDLPYPVSYESVSWVKKHCPSYITNEAVKKKGIYYYRFYFSEEKDQMMFALRWV